MKTALKSYLRKLYCRLPIIHECRWIGEQIVQHRRFMETCSIIQTLETIKASNPRYQDPQRLLAYGAQFWSQNCEDGMIAEIFRRIGVSSKTFLEIGVGNGSENNTTVLLAAGWKGWWIESGKNSCVSIRARLDEMPTIASRLKLRQAFVYADNVVRLLAEMEVPSEVDLFSLDIDLNTYHIWAALEDFRPRVVVVEYNGGIPPDQAWIHPYQPDGVWDGTQAFGASLKAYELLGRKFGYSLVGCDLTGINAFFVKNDLLADHFSFPFTAENHYEPRRYYLLYRYGHPSKFYGESHDR